jgi:hypothetical protein
VISKKGGKPLTVKSMQRIIQNTIYAGINVEKWTDYKPVKCTFDGLITTDLFNRANLMTRVETLFGEMEYIELQLRTLGVE